MKRLVLLVIGIVLFSCEPRQGKSVEEAPPASTKSNVHEIVVQEVLQANNYTYIKGLENNEETWLAILKADVEVGKTYYYGEADEMKNFKSKDLDRTFETVYFLGGIYENPDDIGNRSKASGMGMSAENLEPQRNEPVKEEDLNINLEEGVISIENLYKKKEDLKDKKVVVKGLVTKINPSIMNRNWVHIQDGTGGEDAFDLTITTQDNVKVGAIVSFEGIVGINKDFGHGYTYDLILEEATQLNKQPEIKVN